MSERKIAIIGHFGGEENFTDGQTVKTKTLYYELKKATKWEINIVDTYYKRKNPIKLCVDTIRNLITTKEYIILLSGNGMRVYFPLLSFFAKHLSYRIYHDVIGGNLDKYVLERPGFREYLMSFTTNWVETEGLKKRLNDLGVTNCEVIPNFKRLQCVDAEEIYDKPSPPYKFCTFSRVMKEKGIEDAINAAQAINAKCGTELCELDIYGQIEEGYREEFQDILSKTTQSIRYCGVIDYNESSKVLKDYFALLFPTYWKGEGFPGTIIDALSAGIPIIATDWNENKEIIDNGHTGIVYSLEESEGLESSIMHLISKTNEEYNEMKKACLNDAKKYQADVNIERIISIIRNEKRE